MMTITDWRSRWEKPVDQVHLVLKSTRTGSEVQAAYEDELEAYKRAGAELLEYVVTIPVIRRTPTPSSSSTTGEDTGPASSTGPVPPTSTSTSGGTDGQPEGA